MQDVVQYCVVVKLYFGVFGYYVVVVGKCGVKGVQVFVMGIY